LLDRHVCRVKPTLAVALVSRRLLYGGISDFESICSTGQQEHLIFISTASLVRSQF
jgi:hypothetical protein